MGQSSSHLTDFQRRSTNTSSRQAPFPSMLILMSTAISKAVNSRLVNCERWRVLKLSGSPKRAMASSTASMQKAVSLVIESQEASTSRE